MALTNEQLEKIAKLSKISMSDNDKELLKTDLNNILKMIEKMQSVDSSKIEPLSHPHDLFQRLREDVVTEKDQRDRFLKNAPLIEKDFFLVPKAID